MAMPILRLTAHLTATAILLSAGIASPSASAEEVKVFNDWTLRCEDTGPIDKRSCLITAIGRDPKTKAEVVGVAIGTAQPGDPLRMAIKTAPQVEKEAGVRLQVGDAPAYAAPYEGCTKDACVLRFTPPDALLTQMKKGKSLSVALTPAGTKEPTLNTVSLAGFSKALTAMTSRKPR